MSNVRVAFESGVAGRATPVIRGGGGVPSLQYDVEGGDSRRVLEPDKNPRTLVVIIHEEEVN
jgi:hypothetical protein